MNRINLKNKFSLFSNKLNSKQKIIEMDSFREFRSRYSIMVTVVRANNLCKKKY